MVIYYKFILHVSVSVDHHQVYIDVKNTKGKDNYKHKIKEFKKISVFTFEVKFKRLKVHTSNACAIKG